MMALDLKNEKINEERLLKALPNKFFSSFSN